MLSRSLAPNRGRFFSAGVATALIGVASFFVATAGGAAGAPSGDGVQPTEITTFDGNPTCENLLGPGYVELKTTGGNPGDQTLTDGTLSVVLDFQGNENAGTETVNWSSNLGIDLVIVKGGPTANSYNYHDPPAPDEDTADTLLHAPANPTNGKFPNISHVSFCYDLELAVQKTVQTTFTRSYDWQIAKTNDAPNPVEPSPGQSFLVNYEVTASLNGAPVDSGWAVNGTITVTNPSNSAVVVDSVTDVVSTGINATVDCNGAAAGNGLPATVAAKGQLVCTYSTTLPDGQQRTNTATATSSTAGMGSGSDTEDVVFGNPTTLVDECITVSDNKVDLVTPEVLGTVCAGDAPKTFKYSKEFGPYPDECLTPSYTNTASFLTVDDDNDTGENGSATSTVNVEVQCTGGGGCTLTQGYWKTHSREGPAPYDEAWKNLGSLEEDTPFFNLSQTPNANTWYVIFWTPPKNGNAFLILAHQYQAAHLNVLDGASVPSDVQDALDDAADLLDNYTNGIPKPTGAIRASMLELAGILGAYNEGTTGPGHCSEDATSSITP